MTSQVQLIRDSLANLIVSFDSNEPVFHLSGIPSSNENTTTTTTTTTTSSTSSSISNDTSLTYQIPAHISTKTVEWYDSSIASIETFSDSRKNYILELATKNLIYHYATTEQEQAQLSLCACLLDIMFVLRNNSRVEPTLPHLLLEELLDIQTIAWCQTFWPYLVSRNHFIAHNLTGTRAPGTTLIRLGNSLLRRLSKTQHAQFSGEILMYLARAFPLTEKSGLNIRGAFNIDNITFYKGDGRQNNIDNDTSDENLHKEQEEKDQDVEMKDVQPESATSNQTATEASTATTTTNNNNNASNIPIAGQTPATPATPASPANVTSDANPANDEAKLQKDAMYRKFWSLQDAFRDPTTLFNSETMVHFKTTISSVLSELKKWESQYSTRRDRENEIRRQEMDLSDDDDDDEEEDNEDNENNNNEDDDTNDNNDNINNDTNSNGKQSHNKQNHKISSGAGDTLTNAILFVPKWLTRRDLFELQLKDVSFRRSVLTQMSILIDFLLSLDNSPDEPPKKGASATAVELAGSEATNKSVMYQYTLDSADHSFFIDLRRQIRRNAFVALDFQPPYLRTIDAVLSRDRFWQAWKLRSCPSFGLKPINAESKVIEDGSASTQNSNNDNNGKLALEEATEKLQLLRRPRPKYVHKMGTMQLSQIWKIPIGTEMLKEPRNFEIKRAEEYYKSVKETEEEFKNNYEVELEVTDDEQEEEDKGKETKPNDKDGTVGEKKPETEKNEDDVGNNTNPINDDEKKKTKKTKLIKKMLASNEERREFNETIGSKTWRGLRAARAQGMWIQFGKITRTKGLGALFDNEEEGGGEEEERNHSNEIENKEEEEEDVNEDGDDNTKGEEEEAERDEHVNQGEREDDENQEHGNEKENNEDEQIGNGNASAQVSEHDGSTVNSLPLPPPSPSSEHPSIVVSEENNYPGDPPNSSLNEEENERGNNNHNQKLTETDTEKNDVNDDGIVGNGDDPKADSKGSSSTQGEEDDHNNTVGSGTNTSSLSSSSGSSKKRTREEFEEPNNTNEEDIEHGNGSSSPLSSLSSSSPSSPPQQSENVTNAHVDTYMKNEETTSYHDQDQDQENNNINNNSEGDSLIEEVIPSSSSSSSKPKQISTEDEDIEEIGSGPHKRARLSSSNSSNEKTLSEEEDEEEDDVILVQ